MRIISTRCSKSCVISSAEYTRFQTHAFCFNKYRNVVEATLHPPSAHRMKKFYSTSHSLIGICLLLAAPFVGGQQIKHIPSQGAIETWAQNVAVRFSKCFGAQGTLLDVPIATGTPPSREMLATVELTGNELISDGYRHTLLIHGPSNKAYVVRSGGYAGTIQTLGPLPLSTSCPTHPFYRSSQADAKLAR